MTEYEEKRGFICTKLAPLVMAISEDVVNVRYAIREHDKEFVIVTFRSGSQRIVHVTGDSLKAIVGDVLETI